ncbi:MAG: porin family protein [Maribacter sp.]|uniref:porin family protein n=1 Tax=Maribacter sp. TaxID=1897614 RepID=UPI0032995546
MTCKHKTIPCLFFKGLFLSGFLFVLSPMSVGAQEPRLGVKGGLTYATIAGDLTEGINPRLSGHLGVFVNFEFSDKFAIQPELLYSSQGFRFNTDLVFIQTANPQINEPDFTTAVQFNYVSIPLIAQFELSDRIAIEFGPQFAFLLNQVTKIKDFDGLDTQNLNERESVSGNFQLDYGAAVGILVHINDRFSVSPRFYLGLRNRLNGAIGNIQNYNAALQLSANYSFL